MGQLNQGDVVDGYTYRGGDPNNQASWVREISTMPPAHQPNGLSREAAASTARETGGDGPSLDALTIGAGRFMDKVKSGGAQAYLGVRKLFAPHDPNVAQAQKDLASDEADNDLAYKELTNKHPLDTAIGESTPTMPFSSGGIIASGVKSAIPGFLKFGNADEKLADAGISGAAGIAGNLVGRGVRATGDFLNPNLSGMQRQTLQAGRDMGLNPRLSQVLKSPSIERFEDFSARVPGGAGVMEDFEGANALARNRGAANSILQPPDASGQVSTETFANAHRDLGRVFDEIRGLGVGPNGQPPISLGMNNTPPGGVRLVPGGGQAAPNGGLFDAAEEVLRTQSTLAPEFQSGPLQNLASRLRDAARHPGAAMTGEQYQNNRSALTRMMNSAFEAGDSQAGQGYQALLEALDDTAEQSLRSIGRIDLADQLNAARPAYRNLMMLESGRVAEGGNISGPRVAQGLRTRNSSAFRQGQVDGPLGVIGQWAEQFPSLRAGSQTMERGAVRDMVTDPLSIGTLGLPARAIAGITTDPIVTRIPQILGGTPAGNAVEGAIDLGSIPANAGAQGFLRRYMRPQTP